jgi:hypothetical protein
LHELEAIEHRLKQYATPFSCLEAYWMGYENGYAGRQYELREGDFIAPDGFHQFVSEHFGRRWPNAKGWRMLIREQSASEREAFDLFFKLRFDYEKKKTPTA